MNITKTSNAYPPSNPESGKLIARGATGPDGRAVEYSVTHIRSYHGLLMFRGDFI
jgi:hypothetical protein